jgi:uncharacterized membrane protein (GlpM family)
VVPFDAITLSYINSWQRTHYLVGGLISLLQCFVILSDFVHDDTQSSKNLLCGIVASKAKVKKYFVLAKVKTMLPSLHLRWYMLHE